MEGQLDRLEGTVTKRNREAKKGEENNIVRKGLAYVVRKGFSEKDDITRKGIRTGAMYVGGFALGAALPILTATGGGILLAGGYLAKKFIYDRYKKKREEY